MTFRFLPIFILILVLASPCIAAEEGLYLDLHGGFSDLDNIDIDAVALSFDPGYMAGVSVGYDYGFFKTELELSHRSNDVDKIAIFGRKFDSAGDMSVTAFTINVFAEYENRTPFVPYGGLGVGWSVLDFNGVSAGGFSVNEDSDDGPLAQVIAGLGYEASRRWRINLDYRAVAASIAWNGEDDDSVDDDYFSSGVSLGVNYYF